MLDWFQSMTASWNFSHVFAWIAGPGFAVWYAVHTTRVTIPGIVAKQEETTQRIIADFTAELREIRDENAKVISEMRNHHRDDMNLFWRELKAENRTRHEDSMRLTEVVTVLTSKIAGDS